MTCSNSMRQSGIDDPGRQVRRVAQMFDMAAMKELLSEKSDLEHDPEVVRVTQGGTTLHRAR